MRHSPRQIRLALFVIAGLLGLSASYIHFAELLPLEPSYVSSATFRSDLLTDTLSMYAVQSVVGSTEFQRTAGARIEIVNLPGEPTGFRLSADDLVQQRAESALERAKELLRIKLRALALTEVEASREYLENLRGEIRLGQREESEALKKSMKPRETPEAILSEQKTERAILLRREVSALERFLRYQERPDWFDAKMDSGTLRSAQREVEEAKAELLKLREVFTAHGTATQAQAKTLQKKRAQLQALEKHLAKALLQTHRVELKGMEASALVAIKEAATQTETSQPTPQVTPLPQPESEDDWLSKHSRQLAEQARTMAGKATLHQTSDPVTHLTRPLGYWLSTGLWLGALGLLLAALFVRPPSRSARSSALRAAALTGESLKSDDDKLDQLVSLLVSKWDSPGRLLVLGYHGQERSSLSLRLAQRLSSKCPRVRLVDFDFQSRPLSERVGDTTSPGVSDLLMTPGPADEFFASLPGTSIQFAPAGTLRELKAGAMDADWLFTSKPTDLTVIDASFSSPLHLVLNRVDAVVCLYQQGTPWNPAQSEVLSRLRSSGLPIWGVAFDGLAVSRFF